MRVLRGTPLKKQLFFKHLPSSSILYSKEDTFEQGVLVLEYDFLNIFSKRNIPLERLQRSCINYKKECKPLNYGMLHGDLWLENILAGIHLNLGIVDFQGNESF